MSAIKKKKDHKGFNSFIKGLVNLSHEGESKYIKLEAYPWNGSKYAIAAIKEYPKDPEKELFIVVASLPKIKFIKYKLQNKGAGIWGNISTVGKVM